MSIADKIRNEHSFLIKKIQNANSNYKKRELLEILMGNLLNAGIIISIRQLAKILKITRPLVKKVWESFFESNDKIKKEEKKEKEKRGRKKIWEKYPNIIFQIKEICEKFEVVDNSLQDEIVYVNLTLRKIKNKLVKEYKYEKCPCINTIRRILVEELNYKMTRVKKKKVFKKIKETDAIFSNVNKKLEEAKSNPSVLSLSIDDKTAKYIGNLSGGGYSWMERHALDHDTLPDYIMKPFGIMNLRTKKVDVYCTTSNSTADFKVDCLDEYLAKELNKKIDKVLIFLDNGPENSSRRKLWKKRIIELSLKYQISIELVYYPPYHSKYNKIEHYWGVLQRSWGGLILDTLDKAIGVINGTTWSGIPSVGHLRTKEYIKGQKVDEEKLKILEEKHLSYPNKGIEKWSILITP